MKSDNLYILENTFRKLTPREEPHTACLHYAGCDYQAEITNTDTETKEVDFIILGYLPSKEPALLPDKDKLLSIESTGTVLELEKQVLFPVSPPRVVLTLPQYAAHNCMLLTKSDRLDEASKWRPLLATAVPVVANIGSGPKTA